MGDNQLTLQGTTIPSQTDTLSIKKVGSSDSVIITPLARRLSLTANDQVLVRLSVPTDMNRVICGIADRIEDRSYTPLNTKFRLDYDESEDCPHPSRYYGSEAGAIIDQSQLIFETVTESMIGFLQTKLNNEFAYFSPQTSEFVRTYPPDCSDTDCPLNDDIDEPLTKEKLTVEFLQKIAKDLGLESTKLKLAQGIMSTINTTSDVYDIILSSQDDHDEIVSDLNSQWKTYSTNMAGNAGYYISIRAVILKESDDKSMIGVVSDIRYSLSHGTSRKYDRNGKKYPEYPEDARLLELNDFGPMTKKQALSFQSYLETSIVLDDVPMDIRAMQEYSYKQCRKFEEKMIGVHAEATWGRITPDPSDSEQ